MFDIDELPQDDATFIDCGTSNALAHAGFDPATTGLWAQHANRCANVLTSYIS
jgi:hypothetical protein